MDDLSALIERAEKAAEKLREDGLQWHDGVAVRGGTYPPDFSRALCEWTDGRVYIGRSFIGSHASLQVEGVPSPHGSVSLNGLLRWRLLPEPPKTV